MGDDATWLGRHKIGAGLGAVKADAWDFTMGQSNVTPVVTADGSCTPVSSTRTGNFYGEDQQRTTLYYDYKSSISAADKRLLVKPDGCDNPYPTGAPQDAVVG